MASAWDSEASLAQLATATFESRRTHSISAHYCFCALQSEPTALMWVLDLGVFEIHMDDKPPKCLPENEPERESQHEREPKRERCEQQGEGEKPKPKRRRRVVDSSTTCAPEQLLCRYANKKCLNPRDVKRTGGLHTFCAMHRANANRNQRRLDLRKRLQKQALRAQQEGASMPILTPTPRSRAASSRSPSPQITPVPIINTDAIYEPLSIPTPLQEEDISTLVTLFLPPSPEFVAPSPASTTTSISPVVSSRWSARTHGAYSNNWSPSSSSTQGTPSPPHDHMRF